jgi:radical SAM protein with 4Fe4S-binding SPASM domain
MGKRAFDWDAFAACEESVSLTPTVNNGLRPLQVTWETTKCAEWKTGHPGGGARPARNQHDLSTAEAFHLVDEVAELRVPWLALIGGDPLARLDLIPILQYASQRSVRTSATLLPTARVTQEAIADLKECGVMRIAFWIHASNSASHDAISGHPNSFQRTLQAIGWCHEVDVPVQINTTIARRNFRDLEPVIELVTRLDVDLWSVFFLVPAAREQGGEMLNAAEHEEVFEVLFKASRQAQFQIKTTEAPHYQRYLVQQRVRGSRGRLGEAEAIAGAPQGAKDGRGFVFVDCAGEVYPSRFLPLSAGNVTAQPLSQIYRESPLFVSVRDSSRLKGKCGRCFARNVCGGSRARAYAVSGDLWAEEPCCAYQPPQQD